MFILSVLKLGKLSYDASGVVRLEISKPATEI
jgi:hypothetical protein